MIDPAALHNDYGVALIAVTYIYQTFLSILLAVVAKSAYSEIP
jgi:hypothetical protein